jgi:hydrogenase maturation protease
LKEGYRLAGKENRILILGLGNPILSDDGIGLLLTKNLDGKIPGVECASITLAGLELLDILVGYDHVFLIDAATGTGGEPGELKELEDGNCALHLFTSHGVNFFEILRLGRDAGLKMPEPAAVFGIEIGNATDFGTALTPPLLSALPYLETAITGRIQEIMGSL